VPGVRGSPRPQASPLHLRFYTDEEGRSMLRPNIQPKPEHQGYPGHLHGGIISALLDVPTQISMNSDSQSV
jgi:acyl-coenzyme A thioesterase PaaI-like protein